ncbi:MAG: clostripain-related cysteine peptidase [Atribacterota bacterium]|nr:clostripain-related cysteine peptidase [Atribacterota bacterium]MDD5637587.1 clostripain-related cysteine peptidase [Atribacterota bacterium]
MEKRNRPVGRQKRVGEGTGSVKKRGSGLKGKTGGPVGMPSGGYSGRLGRPTGSTGGTSYPPTGGSTSSSGGCLKYIGIIVFILLVAYYLFSNMGGEPGNITDLLTDSDSISTTSYQTQVPVSDSFNASSGAYLVDTSVSELARAKRVFLRGKGEDTVTVMVYMCGTDLEAQAGMATSDLQEMLNAEISDKVNIIIETGGTSRWQNNVIDSRTNQRYRLINEGLVLLEEDLGKSSMVNPATLSDFIRYCKANYPANRYLLVMWDHGGGSLSGYGHDQYYPNDSMTLDEIARAVQESSCTFDLIGFDACLMATLETAIALEPYADYMIASEEVEPGIGWYYTGWITALSENTSIPTIELGKRLIDDYIRDVRSKVPQSQGTLSLVDLAELKGTIPSVLAEFANATNKMIVEEKDYKAVSDARAGTKEFARSSRISQIDLIHFAENLRTEEAESFAEALRGCIKYNRTTNNITNANGLSVFFPYGRLTRLNSMLETYEEINMSEEYSECIKSFASVMAGGQVISTGSGNLLETLLTGFSNSSQTQSAPAGGISGADVVGTLLNSFLSGGDYSNITGLVGDALGWLDVDLMKESVDVYKENQFDASALVITEKGDQRVLSLSEKQWDLVQYMEMNVFVDDGEGFIDLGLDNIYEYNEDGDLIMDYDGTWLALNGNIVSYYLVSDDRSRDTYSIKGRIPALLNDQLVDIIVVFDNEEPYGLILGAQIKYDQEPETETIAKGLLGIVEGDRIDFLCDYYTYEGEYDDTYYLGNQYTATGEWEIENLSIGINDYQMTYRITDIYGNQYWTPSITN